MAKILKKVLIAAGVSFGLLFGSLLVLLVVLITFGISIDLGRVRGKVESAASAGLEREVRIEGPIKLVPSMWPSVNISNIRIKNPENWNRYDFASIKSARVEVGIIPLIFGSLHLREIKLGGVEVRLERKSVDESNWIFDIPSSIEGRPKDSRRTSKNKRIDLKSVDDISIRNVLITYEDLSDGNHYEVRVNDVRGHATRGRPLELEIEGALQRHPYQLVITGGSIEEFLSTENPWPLKLHGGIAGASLELNGSTVNPMKLNRFDLRFRVSGDRFQDLDGLFESELPAVGSYDLRGNISRWGYEYRLNHFEGDFGNTKFRGDFRLDMSNQSPNVEGSLLVDVLDAKPLLAAFRNGSDNPKNSRRGDENLENTSQDFLNSISADVEVKMGEVINLPVGIRDVSIMLDVKDGVLRSPVSFEMTGVPVKSILEFDNRAESPSIKLDLKAGDSNLTGLIDLFYKDGIEGSVNEFLLTMSGNGEDLGSVLDNLDLEMEMKGIDFWHKNGDLGRVSLYSMDVGNVTLKRGKELKGDIKGKLLGKPVSIGYSGCGLSSFLKGDKCAVNLSASGSGARLSVKGKIYQNNGRLNTNLNAEISGGRIGELYPWIEVSEYSLAPYDVVANIILTEEALHVASFRWRIGRSEMNGDLGWSGIDTNPIFFMTLFSELLDLNELSYIFSSGDANENQIIADESDFDIPVLPKRVRFDDDDLDITIKRLIAGSIEITDISLKSRVRGGVVERSPFQASVGGSLFEGSYSLDLRGDVPQAHIDLDSRRVDIGSLLDELNIAKGMVATSNNMSLAIDLKGSKLSDILRSSALTADLEGGAWTIYDPNMGEFFQILITRGNLNASPESKTTLKLDGMIAETPLRLRFQTDPLSMILFHEGKLPIDILAEASGAVIKLTGSHSLPLTRRDLEFKMSIAGERMDSLDDLFGLRLPPLNPFEINGQVHIDEQGYRISDLAFLLGQSDLKGNLSLTTSSGTKPHLEVDLITKKLDISDFDFGDWSPLPSRQGHSSGSHDKSDLEKAQAKNGEVEYLISPSVMQSHDATVSIKVEEVYSGKDRLGSGFFEASLENGTLSIHPLELELPGGLIDMALVLEMGDSDIGLNAAINIDNFDYGILARRIDPKSEASGLMDLDLELESTAGEADSMIGNASGGLRFTIWPRDFEAGVFDLWALSLLNTILPKWGGKAKSGVNCILADFKLRDGVAKPKRLLIDTTNVRVRGKGEVDFKSRKLNLVFKPRPKKPQLFNLGIPVKVSGPFDDFRVRTDPHDFVWFLVRVSFFVYDYVLQLLNKQDIPIDGSDVCGQPIPSTINESLGYDSVGKFTGYVWTPSYRY